MIVYSLTQQLVRQELGYYLLYVALRLDHNPRLVSYLYYTKYAKPNGFTIFRHININDCQDIPAHLRARLQRRNRTNAGMLTDLARISSIRQLFECRSKGVNSLQHVCYRYLQAAVSYYGLKTKSLKLAVLRRRVEELYEYRSNLDEYRRADATYKNFRLVRRPEYSDD